MTGFDVPNYLDAATYVVVVLVSSVLYFAGAGRSGNKATESEVRGLQVLTAGKVALRILALLILVVFQGTRWRVGTDTGTYLSIFESVPSSLEQAFDPLTHEPLFIATAWFVKNFGLDGDAFLLVASLLAILPIFLAARLLDGSPRVILYYCLLGFYLGGFNTVRQSIATAFVFLGFAQLSRSSGRYRWAGVLSFVCAVGFHYTAVVPAVTIVALLVVRAGYRAVAAGVMITGGLAAYQLGVIQQLAGLAGYGGYFLAESEGAGGVSLLALFALVGALIFIGGGRSNGMVAALFVAGVICLAVSVNYLYFARLAGFFLIFSLVQIGAKPALRIGMARGFTLFAIALISFVARVAEFGDLVPYESWLIGSPL